MKTKLIFSAFLCYFVFNSVCQAQLYTPNGTVNFSSTGNVGVGISNPSYGRFVIFGSGSDQGLTMYGTGVTSLRQYVMSSDNKVYFNRGGDVTKGFALDADGNFGIGTAIPSAKLSVSSTTSTPFSINWNTGSAWSYGSIINVNQNYAKCWAVMQPDGLDRFYVLGNGDLFAKGNVTIGTTNNMGYKLAVNGGIIAEEVKVITDVPNADYVFDSEYKLNSISELEKYIKENKHLPNIPSAEQFKKDGYKVGQMDEMLLRKVEELSLYLIEQNKRIEALEKENKELKSKPNL